MRFQKRFFLLAVLVLAAAALKFQMGSENFEVVEEFRGANIKADVFSPMIAQSVNSKTLRVTLNEQSYTNTKDGIYMNEQLNIMVPQKALEEGLRCSARIYNEEELLILQGETEIHLFLEDTKMIVDDLEVEMDTPMTKRGNTYYVPLQQLMDYLNFELSFDMESNAAVATSIMETSFLPTQFDLRDYGRLGNVADQQEFGTCWAFASLKALESSMLPEQQMSFSADHMSMRNSFSSDQNSGGEYTMGMAYLTAWQGPVLEKDDPYGDGISPDGIAPVGHVQEIQLLETKNLQEIKEAIFKSGAVQTSLYCNTHNGAYYNEETYAYCYRGTENVNHDVIIIGWDDAFPKDRFATEPEGDGAFICQNSWGTQFGDGGYFYVSYYDDNIGEHCISYCGLESADNYDRIYQSDLRGWGGQLGYNKSSLYAANVFTAESDEILTAVGFYATGRNTSYEVYVVPQFESVESLEEGFKVASGTKTRAGYYTVSFSSRITIEPGKKFAVVLKIDTPGSNRPLAVEYVEPDSGVTIDLSDGESYISPNGKKWASAEETKNCNICLKAYTKKLK